MTALMRSRPDVRPRVQLSSGVHRSASTSSGAPHGITAEMVTLGGTKMDEPARYRVIVDRISHEVEYYRGALKHAVLQGTYVINNPFWWTADDKFFNYSVMAKLGVRDPEDRAAAAEGRIRRTSTSTPESLRNLRVPDRLGRAARLRRASGDPEAVLGRRLEARLQGARQARSCSRRTTGRRRTA